MSDSSDSHFYDLQSYIVKHGNIADKMRLISAGYRLPEDIVNTTLNALERVLNRDGGVPIDLMRGNPSSVKETAEMLPLLGSFKKTHRQLIQKMLTAEGRRRVRRSSKPRSIHSGSVWDGMGKEMVSCWQEHNMAHRKGPRGLVSGGLR
ncbi:MAG: hypothetical protein ACFFH0_11700 [Promethearchaeota archaeon]